MDNLLAAIEYLDSVIDTLNTESDHINPRIESTLEFAGYARKMVAQAIDSGEIADDDDDAIETRKVGVIERFFYWRLRNG